MELPSKVFVKWENVTDPKERYLEAHIAKSALAEVGESVVIGEYKLVRISTVELHPVETNFKNVERKSVPFD